MWLALCGVCVVCGCVVSGSPSPVSMPVSGGAKKKDQTDGTKFSEKDQNDGTKFSGIYIKNTPKRTPHPIPI